MERRYIRLKADLDGKRVDIFLKEKFPIYSREYIKKLIKEGFVLVNGEVKKPSYKVKKNDLIEIKIEQEKKLNLEPEKLELEILYEDDDIMVVNKPQGMLTHPVGKIRKGTLVNALLYYAKNLSSIGGVIRPGIVHRLDKDTSGLLLIAKNDLSHKILSNDLKERRIKRIYYALVKGVVKEDKGVIEIPLTRSFLGKKFVKPSFLGKEAITEYKVIERFLNHSLLEISLKTGRTHQIRVHLSYIGYPIIGDKVYGVKEPNLKGQLLHAKKIIFTHPIKKEEMFFESELPDYFKEYLQTLQKV